MATLAVVLVLAVGFVAFGALMQAAAVLLVFGAGFLAVATFLLGKLLVVSHVHIRGTAARLEALNERYDLTARWLERFDADTRESFLVTKERLAAADKATADLGEKLEVLRGDTPRLEAFEALGGEAARKVDVEKLTAKVGEHHESLLKTIEEIKLVHEDSKSELKALVSGVETTLSDAESKLSSSIDSLGAELRSELPDLGPLSERLGVLKGEIEALHADIEAANTIASELADGAKAAASEQIATAKTELDEGLRAVNARVTKFDDQHERKRRASVHAAKEEATEAVASLAKRVDKTAQLSARLRGDGYVQFQRVLSGDAIEGAKAFGSKVTPGHLKYLERKLQVIEGLCEGRLAGSVDDAIGRALCGQMVRGKEIRILEIGVLFGVGAAFMHHALAPRHERVHLALLDPFQGYYGKDHLDPLTGLPVTRAAVERNMARCGIDAEDYSVLEGFSHEDAIREAADDAGPYHIIIIDGDHSAEGVRVDYEGYADMLRSGGLLVIDDYGSEDWPAVTAFVDETVRSDPRFRLVAVIGKTAVFKRTRGAGGGKKAAAASRSGGASKKASSKKAAATEAVEPKAAAEPETVSPEAPAESEATASPVDLVQAEPAGEAPKPQQQDAAPAASAASGEDATESEPPVPVVKTPRRGKAAAKKASKKAAKKAAKKTTTKAPEQAEAVLAVDDETGDAAS